MPNPLNLIRKGESEIMTENKSETGIDERSQTWVKCLSCDRFPRFTFYTATMIYCENCGTQVGQTEQPVHSDTAALSDGVVIDADSGEVLSHIHWFPDETEQK